MKREDGAFCQVVRGVKHVMPWYLAKTTETWNGIHAEDPGMANDILVSLGHGDSMPCDSSTADFITDGWSWIFDEVERPAEQPQFEPSLGTRMIRRLSLWNFASSFSRITSSPSLVFQARALLSIFSSWGRLLVSYDGVLGGYRTHRSAKMRSSRSSTSGASVTPQTSNCNRSGRSNRAEITTERVAVSFGIFWLARRPQQRNYAKLLRNCLYVNFIFMYNTAMKRWISVATRYLLDISTMPKISLTYSSFYLQPPSFDFLAIIFLSYILRGNSTFELRRRKWIELILNSSKSKTSLENYYLKYRPVSSAST